MNFVQVLYKILIPTSQQTQYIFFIKTNRLILFTEMIAVYSKNDTTPINTFCGKNIGLLSPQALRIIATTTHERAKLRNKIAVQDTVT
jgi:hypothetical protein